MRFLKLTIRNLRSIEAMEIPIPARGVVAKGKNGIGKTTILRSLSMALGAEPLDPDAIRIGADRAEIVVDFDELTVKRSVTRKGNGGLKLTTKDGAELKRPVERLRELLGPATLLDPLALVSMKGPQRREAVLAALPITTSADELRRWAPDLGDFSVSPTEHGLEAVKRAHQAIYDRRKLANADEARLTEDARRAEAEATRLAAAAPTEDVPNVSEAQSRKAEADAAIARLAARRSEVEAARARTSKQRARIEELRETARALRPAEPETPDDVIDEVREQVRESDALIADLEAQLAAARKENGILRGNIVSLTEFRENARRAKRDADALVQQAADLEAALATAIVEPPSAEEIDAAQASLDLACAAMIAARRAEDAQRARVTADDAKARAQAAKAQADRLDAQVRALREDAPKALLARCGGIDGLQVLDDDVALDGVKAPELCGAEQLWFATQIAKKVNAKSRLLLVDGLEALDPEGLKEFVSYATEGGFVLLGTRVSGGDLVLVDPEVA